MGREETAVAQEKARLAQEDALFRAEYSAKLLGKEISPQEWIQIDNARIHGWAAPYEPPTLTAVGLQGEPTPAQTREKPARAKQAYSTEEHDAHMEMVRAYLEKLEVEKPQAVAPPGFRVRGKYEPPPVSSAAREGAVKT